MRQVICLAALLIWFTLLTSCDSTQPQEVGEQFMQIEIAAGNATIQVYDVWEQYYDMNGDGIPDETDPGGNLLETPVEIACRKATSPTGTNIIASGFTAWNYALEISIIRAGTTEVERLTTAEALLSSFNMTEYATITIAGMQQPGLDCPNFAVCNPIGRLPGTHRIVIDSTYQGPFTDLVCPGSPGLGQARMGGTAGNPGPVPFSLTVEKGDTVLVDARKNFSAPEGIILLSEPTLQGTLFLGGLQIQNLNGTSVSVAEPRAGISFSFTVN
jgi:hypothetical protein